MDDEEHLLSLFRAAAASDLELLASLHDRELDAETLAQLRASGFPRSLGLNPSGPEWLDAVLATERALDNLAEAGPAGIEMLAAAYADVYLTYGLGVSPSESPWIDPDGLERQEPMLENRRWYRRHNLKVPNWRTRPDDHLVHQLNFVAFLLGGEKAGAIDEASRFIKQHIMRWLPQFASRLDGRNGPEFYSALAALTFLYVRELSSMLEALNDGTANMPPPPPSVGAGCRACHA